jgi:hypothetical protein
MIPAAAVGPTDQFQEAINEYWYGLLKEYANAGQQAWHVTLKNSAS